MSTGLDNPFETPKGDSSPVLGLSTGILESLKQTRPWVLLMGILCFIGAAMTIVIGLVFAVMMAFGGGGPFGVSMGIAAACLYLLMGVLYIFPGVFLVRYANKINTLLSAPSTEALEAALIAQKSFWKFVGISVLALFGLYLVIIVISMFAGVAASI